MSSQSTSRRDLIIGLVALAVIAAGIVVAFYFVYRAIVDFFTSASPQLGSAVIGTAGLVFVAVVANFGAKIYEQRQQIQQEQRAKKAEVYGEFMAFWFRLLTGDEAEEDEKDDEGATGHSDVKEGDQSTESQDEVEAYLRGFTYQLVSWGSETFLRNYVVFKRKVKHNESGDALLYFEKVLLEIRRDLGFKNKGLERGDLLKVFLDDSSIDNLIAVDEDVVEPERDIEQQDYKEGEET